MYVLVSVLHFKFQHFPLLYILFPFSTISLYVWKPTYICSCILLPTSIFMFNNKSHVYSFLLFAHFSVILRTIIKSSPLDFLLTDIIFLLTDIIFLLTDIISCSPILFSCSPILFSCSPILFSCSLILFSCSPILFSCSPILFSCSPILFSCFSLPTPYLNAFFISCFSLFTVRPRSFYIFIYPLCYIYLYPNSYPYPYSHPYLLLLSCPSVCMFWMVFPLMFSFTPPPPPPILKFHQFSCQVYEASGY